MSQDFEKIGKVSSASVSKGTGKSWKQWVEILGDAGARAWTHQEIVAVLRKKYRLTPWWQQGVAHGFEVAIGRRQAGQDLKGNFMVTTTKSLPWDAKRVWKALMSEAGQKVWLKPFSQIKIAPKVQFETEDGFFGEIRTMKVNRRLRMFWQDPLWEKRTVVELMMAGQMATKTILVFNHTGLTDRKTQTAMRARWRKAADQVAGLF